jgi:hypothetical protein
MTVPANYDVCVISPANSCVIAHGAWMMLMRLVYEDKVAAEAGISLDSRQGMYNYLIPGLTA